ncbi:MAG: hypothetical protein H5T86_15220 [Armatimonadetes bacterium]|nr:hypothetical protein [Armatimonadota bacterium]
MLAPAVRAAADELHERRLAVVEGPGIVAPVRWPRLASLGGKLRMNLADQLAAAGADVDEGLAGAWAEADDKGAPPEAEPSVGGPVREVFLAIGAAHRGDLPASMEHCRHATAGTIVQGVVPMLARMAGWLERMMTALKTPQARAVRYSLPPSQNQQAQALFTQGWQAEIVRSRERARAAYVAALHADPGFDQARLRYAAVLFAIGETDAALSELGRLATARPRLWHAHLMRAEMLLRAAAQGAAPEGWDAEAQRHLDVVASLTGADLAWADTLRAQLSLMRGDVDSAVAVARRAIALEPSLARAYHCLGQGLVAGGELLAGAWAEAAALLADYEFVEAAEALFALRQSPQVASQVPHARQLIDESWQ